MSQTVHCIRCVLFWMVSLACLVSMPVHGAGSKASSALETEYYTLDYKMREWERIRLQTKRIIIPLNFAEDLARWQQLAGQLGLKKAAQAKEIAESEAAKNALFELFKSNKTVEFALQGVDLAIESANREKGFYEQWERQADIDSGIAVTGYEAADAAEKRRFAFQKLKDEAVARQRELRARVEQLETRKSRLTNFKSSVSTLLALRDVSDNIGEGNFFDAANTAIDQGTSLAETHYSKEKFEEISGRLEVGKGFLATAKKLNDGDYLDASIGAMDTVDKLLTDHTKDLKKERDTIKLFMDSGFQDPKLKKQAEEVMDIASKRTISMEAAMAYKNKVKFASSVFKKFRDILATLRSIEAEIKNYEALAAEPGRSETTTKLIYAMEKLGNTFDYMADRLPPGLKQTVGEFLHFYGSALRLGNSIDQMVRDYFKKKGYCENDQGDHQWSVATKHILTTWPRGELCLNFTNEFSQSGLAVYLDTGEKSPEPVYFFIPNWGGVPIDLSRAQYASTVKIASNYSIYAAIVDSSYRLTASDLSQIILAVKNGRPSFTINDGYFSNTTFVIEKLASDVEALMHLRAALDDELTADNHRAMIDEWYRFVDGIRFQELQYISDCYFILVANENVRHRYFVSWLRDNAQFRSFVARQPYTNPASKCRISVALTGPTMGKTGQALQIDAKVDVGGNRTRPAYQWTQRGRQESLGRALSLNHSPDQPGEITYVFNVLAQIGQTSEVVASASHSVRVEDAAPKITHFAISGPDRGEVANAYVFSANIGATASVRNALRLEWSINGRKYGDASSIRFTGQKAGVYQVALAAYWTTGGTGTPKTLAARASHTITLASQTKEPETIEKPLPPIVPTTVKPPPGRIDDGTSLTEKPVPGGGTVGGTSNSSSCGPYKFSGAATDIWSGGNTEKGFRMDRKKAEKTKPDQNYVTASLTLGAVSSTKSLPQDNVLPALEKEMKEGGTGGVPNDMSTGLEPWTEKAMGGFAIEDFHGGLIDYGLWFKRNFSHSEGRGGSYFGWNGHGYVTKGPCSIEIRYSIGGGGSPEDTDRGYLRSQAQAAKSEIMGILGSLRVDSNGTITKTPYSGRNLDGSDMLKVKLVPESLGKVKLGDSRTIQAVVENARPEDSPFKYTWTGSYQGSGATVKPQTSKAGKYTVSVAVDGAQGPAGGASLEYTVAEPITVKLEKLKPAGNAVVVGQTGSFRVTVMAGKDPAGGEFVTRWEPYKERAAQFKARELPGASGTNDIKFMSPGSYLVYVAALEKVDGALQTAGESEQIPIEVTNPTWEVSFDPAQPKVGQLIKAKIQAAGVTADEVKAMAFEWRLPDNAKQTGAEQKDGLATFYLKDTKPANIQAIVRMDGENLGGAGKTITAQGYQVSIGEPRYAGPPIQMWRCETQLGGAQNCGMVTLKPTQFVTHTDVFFASSIAPAAEAPRYKWSVDPEGSCGPPGTGSEAKINCSNTGTYTVKVEVTNAEAVKLGEATKAISISVSQNDISNSSKAKEAFEKLQKAKELVGQGRLDEAIPLAEDASKLDAKNAEATALAKQWKAERESVRSHIKNMDSKIALQKIDEAQAELGEAQRLHSKYPEVVDADKRMKAAKKQAEEERQKLEEAKKQVAEKEARARELMAQASALEQRGDPAEALKKYQESLKLSPNGNAQQAVKRLEAQFGQAKVLWDEGKAAFDAGRKPESLVKMKESLKMWPGNREREAYVAQLEQAVQVQQGQQLQAKRLRDEGEALQGQKRVPEAIAKYRESLKLVPDPRLEQHIQTLERQAEAEHQKQAQAQAQAQRLRMEGESLQQQNRVPEAVAKYRESLKLVADPRLEQHIQTLERQAEAERQKQAQAQAQSQAQAQRLRAEGEALQQQNRIHEAVGKYRESLKLVPDPRLEQHIQTLERQAEAEQQRQAQIQAQAQRLRAEGEAFQRQNNIREAINKYRESLTLRPDPALQAHIQLLERALQAAVAAVVPPPTPIEAGRQPTISDPGGRSYTSLPIVQGPTGQPPQTSAKSAVIYDNGNTAGVYNLPTQATVFSLARPTAITLIQNYHWNNGQGGRSTGTIALRDASGRVYGPWATVGSPGQGGVPNASWTARPNVQIPAGSYTVIDSDPPTWAQNSGSHGAGMTRIEGY